MSASAGSAWTRESLQERIARSPFNAWLGLELESWTADALTLRLRAKPELFGHAGLSALHGGVIASVLDTACSMAVVVRTGESVFTVDMRVDYLRPATCEVYTIRAEIVRLGRTLATADATVRGEDGQAVACARAVLQHIAQIKGKAGARPG